MVGLMVLHEATPTSELCDPAAPGPRLADHADAPVASPVHRLQAEILGVEIAPMEDVVPALPGWLRLGVPLCGSLAIWAVILKALGVF